jgi:transcription-repair coupling factor (superfamily II helicase)
LISTIADLARAVARGGSPRAWAADDARGSAIALLVRQLRRWTSTPIVIVVEHSAALETLVDDLRFVLSDREPICFDAPEVGPYAEAAPDRAASARRMAALFAIAKDTSPVIIVSAAALARKVVPAQRVIDQSELVELGQEIDRERLLARLTEGGYLRVPLVEDVGTLSVRGALIDVWSPSMASPVRVELDGDRIESIKSFDPNDQKSLARLERAWLVPPREMLLDASAIALAKQRVRDLCDAVDCPSSKTRRLIEEIAGGHSFFGADAFLPAFGALEPLCSQLPHDAMVLLEAPAAAERAIGAAIERAESDELEKRGEPHFAVHELFCGQEVIARWLEERVAVGVSAALLAGGEGVWAQLSPARDDVPSLCAVDQAELGRELAHARAALGHGAGLDPLARALESWRADGLSVALIARTSLQAERIGEMLRHRGFALSVSESMADRERALDARGGEAPLSICVGTLRRGVVARADGVVLLTEEEIFGSRAHREKPAKTSAKRARQLLEDLRTLARGDYVVHVDHGIGRYEGLIVRDVGGQKIDLLVVEYAGGDKLYLPAYRLGAIERYRGSDATPALDKLGGQSFARTKSRAKARVRQMADELLRLYAERNAKAGVATPPIDDDYRAFEAAFPYEETADQARAIDEVGVDLEAPRPMDRLVCGDVGFGKTEVALRAAFRVAMSGRQVAVLCPTTVLAQQHKLTFDNRMAGYPMRVAALSRFQSTKEQRKIVLALREGTIDVVIGTHRLLSKDVHFKRLGLLVVDEEQRFGVAAKERIKSLRTDIDVLTLTATPIPRTMQMAVAGIRDLSIITTPPVDRRAVRTITTRWDPGLLREAITRELARGGQVFYVHNRVGGLGERVEMLSQIVPEARIAVAHGQMSEAALERTMLEFVSGEHDILCSTAIIENGLDIPRCNTILIDRADLFGMSQLYQLRGRVGRSKERGYCYLGVPGDLGDEARVRIEAMSRYAELGSGFQVASLDLDLRGAGDMLGAEQSGTVESVGLEMFCRMLEEAVQELKGEPVTPGIDPELSFDVEALLSDEYIADVGVRLSLYKRLASASDRDDVHRLADEMEDRFGRPPPSARRLIQLMAINTDLRRLRVLACEASAGGVTLHLRNDTPLDPAKLAGLMRTTRGQWRLTPDMRLTRRALPSERFASGIEATERVLDEVQSCLDDRAA